jgi:hypothetical protein
MELYWGSKGSGTGELQGMLPKAFLCLRGRGFGLGTFCIVKDTLVEN